MTDVARPHKTAFPPIYLNVTAEGFQPKVALRQRTLWMVKRAGLLVLFPDDPATGTWGRGSTLAFRAAVDQRKPVFVVTRNPPAQSPSYRLVPARLWDLVDGYWVFPHPTASNVRDTERRR